MTPTNHTMAQRRSSLMGLLTLGLLSCVVLNMALLSRHTFDVPVANEWRSLKQAFSPTTKRDTTVADVGTFEEPLSSIDSPVSVSVNATITDDELPMWMTDYFSWHKQTRAEINRRNWRKHRYLVIRCLEGEVCGGLSDRLKTIAYFLRVANESQRILLIYWQRPAPLEHFLQPPPDGLDWRVPDWMKINFWKNPIIRGTDQSSRAVERKHLVVVDGRIQDTNGGGAYYNEHRAEGEPPMREVLGGVWRKLFVPSDAVQRRLDEQTKKLGLTPGKYVAVHARLKYQQEFGRRPTTKRIQNAINCIVSMQPNTPIFLASDSTSALEIGIEYGVQKSLNVVARLDEPPPLHLDKGANFLAGPREKVTHLANENPEDYYDVFVDLFLLAQSSCVGFDVGGYGRWGSMLSTNPKCNVDHLKNKCPLPNTPATKEKDVR